MNKVKSKDGTQIAYEKIGNGPALILVDGAFCNKTFGPMPKLAALLSKDFTVYLYDRRARGDSGDTKPYSVDREIEDIGELINVAGGSSYLFGISSGAILSIKAVVKGLNVQKLAIFEPPYSSNKNGKLPDNAKEDLTRMIEEKRQGDAVKYFLTKLMGAPSFIPFILRFTPNWAKMKANANALPYDLAICGDFEIPKDQISSIKIPTLAIDSIKSPETLRNSVAVVSKTIPLGERKSLNGSVHDVPPKVLAPVLRDFFNGK
jgi:pimeloyl-ACP methyl ester carboxylesterase